MSPPQMHRPRLAGVVARQQQRGLSSGLLLACIAVAGAVLTYTTTVTSTAHTGLAQQIATTRALRAAQAGLAWGRYRITHPATPQCAGSITLSIPLSSGALPVTVRCAEALPSFNESGSAVRVFQLTATACFPAPSGTCPETSPTGDYVQRQAAALVTR